jgi:hypothetical protein
MTRLRLRLRLLLPACCAAPPLPAIAAAEAATALSSWGQVLRLCPSSPQCPHFFFCPTAEWRSWGLRACASRIAREMLLQQGAGNTARGRDGQSKASAIYVQKATLHYWQTLLSPCHSLTACAPQIWPPCSAAPG